MSSWLWPLVHHSEWTISHGTCHCISIYSKATWNR
ncbi:hypothetical protein Pint_12020 [Pistacia integerrima]|uniref:Uncharacterized protein n=1 Tax=Pistacia integerrima TaxID=434235 RepID=A0ACC0XLM0_9ROSI|nr:hypothetical protein Pint_12020 [Pistacia integerrima]